MNISNTFCRLSPSPVNTVSPIAVVGLLGFSTLSLLSARPVVAQVVFDNGGPDYLQAYYSDPGANAMQSDTFSFVSLTSFDTVQWYGLYVSDNTPLPLGDNVTIEIYGTTAGIPNTTSLPGLTFNVGSNVNRTPTGLTLGRFTAYSYSSALPGGVSLPAGTYGISILNSTATDPNDNWMWMTSRQSGNFFAHSNGPNTWLSVPNDLSFRLLNTSVSAAAPEPGSLALLALAGLPIVGVVVRRNRISSLRRLT